MKIPAELVKKLAPTGKLRASINIGNRVLAGLDAQGSPVGVSVDLATNFAKLLGVEVELIVFEAAGKSVEAVASEVADIGFFAIDPLRGKDITFTSPYVLIEGCYMVREDSYMSSNADVDRPGHRVAVSNGSAYDLLLSRELKQAQIVRAPSPQDVADLFIEQGLEVAAGVKQQNEADLQRYPGLRLLPGRFMVINQAMGLPKSRGEEAAALLSKYVEEMKSSGFVAEALKRHGIEGASVAPAE